MSRYSDLRFIFTGQQIVKTSAHLSVISKETDPNNIEILLDGDRYWINGVGVGEWFGQDYNIAIYQNGQWTFEETMIGSIAYVEYEDVYCYYNGNVIQEYGTSPGRHASTHEPGGNDEITRFDAGVF